MQVLTAEIFSESGGLGVERASKQTVSVEFSKKVHFLVIQMMYLPVKVLIVNWCFCCNVKL